MPDERKNAASLQCERLPALVRDPGATTCQCLGDFDVAALLELMLAAGPGRLEITDAGICATCPEGGASEPPGGAARAEAARLLADMGLGALQPVLRKVEAGGLRRDDAAPRRRARRRFLERLAHGRTEEPAASNDRAAVRAATLTALTGIARVMGVPLPGSFFPALAASKRCRDHGVCAATCPTGALARYETDGRRGLRFDPALCTSCGECVRRCPERALLLAPAGVGRNPMAITRLTGHVLGVCERCENDFVPMQQETLCAACRKDAALFINLSQERPNEQARKH